MIKVVYRQYMDLTEAMAHSNNVYFEEVGTRLRFARVHQYARAWLASANALVTTLQKSSPACCRRIRRRMAEFARMSSFGEGIRLTPLQLATLVATLANGGTQVFTCNIPAPSRAHQFQPRVLNSTSRPCCRTSVKGYWPPLMYGTAKQSYDPDGEQSSRQDWHLQR